MPSLYPSAREEIFVDFPLPLSRVPVITAQRSTTVIAELSALRAMGRYDAYVRNLAPEGTPLLDLVAGTWVPMPQLLAHYDACAALNLVVSEQVHFGSHAAQLSFGTLLGTAVRLAKSAGATPWTFFENVARFWSRGYEGGGLRVVKLGPKEARVDFAGNPLFARSFVRNGFRGYALALVGLFCTRVFIRDEGPAPGLSASYRGQWA